MRGGFYLSPLRSSLPFFQFQLQFTFSPKLSSLFRFLFSVCCWSMAGGGGDGVFVLPPGFRFHPTDEEIITHYLSHKILDHSFSVRAMGEVDLNKCEPWDLPGKAKMGEKELYFYSHKDRKYPTGMRTNRATQAGYWKATGKDKEIYRGKGVLVGMKKTLVFYKGRAPKGEKTNWVMHEFRLEGKASLPNFPKSAKDEWVVCRVIHKNAGPRRSPAQAPAFAEDLIMDSATALPPLMDPTATEYSGLMPSSSFINNIDQSRASYDFKGMPPPPPLMNMELQQAMSRQFMASNAHGYLHPRDPSSGGAKICKAEQYSSNNSMGGGGGYCPSQDTGLSADHNTTEISSVMSTHFGDLDDWTSYGFSEFM